MVESSSSALPVRRIISWELGNGVIGVNKVEFGLNVLLYVHWISSPNRSHLLEVHQKHQRVGCVSVSL